MNSSDGSLERWGPIALLALGLLLAVVLNGWPAATYIGTIETISALLGSLFVVALVLERSVAVINDLAIPKTDAENFLRRAAEVLAATKLNLAAAPDGSAEFKTASGNLLTATKNYEAALKNEQDVKDKRARLRLGVGFLAAILITTVGMRTLGSLIQLQPIPERTPPVAQTPAPAPAAVPAPIPGETTAQAEARAQPQAQAQALDQAQAQAQAQEEARRTAAAQPNAADPPKETEAQKSTKRRKWFFDLLDIILTAGLLAGGSNGIARLIDAIRGKPDTGNSTANGLISARLRPF